MTEDGATSSYSISLVAPDATKLTAWLAALAVNPVYLTVSAGVASSSRARNIEFPPPPLVLLKGVAEGDRGASLMLLS